MSRLKRLIDEIHRRSMWQVLLIYCGAALVAYQAVQALTEGLGLPQWFPAFAIVLFIIGLPIVLATAFVHEVAPPTVKPAEPTPLTEAEAARIEAEAAAVHLQTRRRHRFLTWRNAAATFVIVLAAWGVVATGWYLFADRAEPEGTETAAEMRKSIAVLPFENLSPDPENEFFTDGMHDEIIAHLSRIADLKVISRTSVMGYKGRTGNLRAIAEELEVTNILEGTVRRADGRVRITTQLLDALTDEHLWTEVYDHELSDVFAVQSDVAQQVATALRATLTTAERERIEDRPTENLEAYDHYLRGRHFWHRRSLAAFDSAVNYFNQAILLDPQYARAYAALAETYVLIPEYGGPPIPEILPFAKAAAERARALDPGLAEAYTASAYIKASFEWDRDSAERDYLRAIELNPDYATAHQWYGELLGLTGRWDEALAELRKAIELDPLSPAANLMMGLLLAYAGRPDDAIPMYERALRIVPDWVDGIYELANAHVLKGDYADAAPLFDRLAELTGSDPEAYRAYLAALSDPAKTPAAVTALQATDVFSTTAPSEYLAQLGRYEEALAALEQEYEARKPRLPWINVHPMYEGLRSDPRFHDLLRRMNFPE
ncbi:MAG: tetratricopeptide repeat protein [Gemmatimonadetes bacterium]|nr:tetratricopeptide repeat protein [Gemmatimonadota bacterium]